MRPAAKQRNCNYIRAEVERMPWPTIIRDDVADMEREIARLQRAVVFWRMLAVCSLCVLAMIAAKWIG